MFKTKAGILWFLEMLEKHFLIIPVGMITTGLKANKWKQTFALCSTCSTSVVLVRPLAEARSLPPVVIFSDSWVGWRIRRQIFLFGEFETKKCLWYCFSASRRFQRAPWPPTPLRKFYQKKCLQVLIQWDIRTSNERFMIRFSWELHWIDGNFSRYFSFCAV